LDIITTITIIVVFVVASLTRVEHGKDLSPRA